MTALVQARTPDAVAAVRLRSGLSYWTSGYRTMLRWHLVGLRMWLSLLVVIQVLAGVGFVLGMSLFVHPIPPIVALFVSTGVPVVNLLMVGLFLGPQLVADQKIQQSFDFIQALPIPRTASAAAWYTVTLVAGIPAVVVSLLVAVARYHLALSISVAVVPAVLLTCFAGTMLGYALAYAIPNPMTTRLITQLLVFSVFGFTPILFRVSQMPHWLGVVNWWLPFRHMAQIVRASLTDGLVSGVTTSYVIVTAWAIVCAVLSARALGRRP